MSDIIVIIDGDQLTIFESNGGALDQVGTIRAREGLSAADAAILAAGIRSVVGVPTALPQRVPAMTNGHGTAVMKRTPPIYAQKRSLLDMTGPRAKGPRPVVTTAILDWLRTRTEPTFSAADVQAHFGVTRKDANNRTGHLVTRGNARRLEPGLFELVDPPPEEPTPGPKPKSRATSPNPETGYQVVLDWLATRGRVPFTPKDMREAIPGLRGQDAVNRCVYLVKKGYIHKVSEGVYEIVPPTVGPPEEAA